MGRGCREEFLREFAQRGVTLVLHAGDFCSPFALRPFRGAGMPLMGPVALAPLFAYLGQTYFIHNARWNAEMRAYGPAMLGLMGEIFAPFVLPEPGQSLRDPYRASAPALLAAQDNSS